MTGHGEGKKESRAEEENEMQVRLCPNPELFETVVGVSIAGQKHRLEKHHDRIPNSRSAAEQREEHLSEQRLDGKEQSSAQKNGETIDDQHERRGSCCPVRVVSFNRFDRHLA